MSELDIRSKIKLEKREIIPPDYDRNFKYPDDKHTDKRQRHIFIFLDGTWNEERTTKGLATPTNVLRMYQEINHITPQEINSLPESNNYPLIIAHYYRGVGNRQDNNATKRFWFGFNGADEQRIRSAAFADLYSDYKNENDCIYILGFSRGAASARLLAKDICEKGLPPNLHVNTTHFPNLITGQIEARVVRVNRKSEIKADEKEEDYKSNYKPKIQFLGCWDTVDAFVLPSRFPKERWHKKALKKAVRVVKYPFSRIYGERFKGNENNIPDAVNKAVHCVAIDETRNAFLPTLMPWAKNVEEVWFPGVHSDVGGGYDINRLSHGPYDFMKSRLMDAAIAAGIPEDNLFKKSIHHSEISEIKRKSDGYCFHFHGLNTGLSHIKDLAGFGTAMRRIRVLGGDSDVEPKIHHTIFRIMNSNTIFAADPKEKRTWTITYNPYNVGQLGDNFKRIFEKKTETKKR